MLKECDKKYYCQMVNNDGVHLRCLLKLLIFVIVNGGKMFGCVRSKVCDD